MVKNAKNLTNEVHNLTVEAVKCGRSQKEFAKQLKITQSSISKLVTKEKAYEDLRGLPCCDHL